MAPGRQLGFLWGAVAVALVALSPLAPALATALPACPLRGAFGIPCPTCGTTTAALALARFDVATALAANPLAAVAWIGLVGGGLVALGLAVAGRPVIEPRQPSLTVRLAAVALLLADWAYLLTQKS